MIRKAAVAVGCVALMAFGGAQLARLTAAPAASAAGLPPDVTAFKVQRDRCDHWRGEDPTDAARRAFLVESVKRDCGGTDARLHRLRERYAADHAVSEALASYEDRIE